MKHFIKKILTPEKILTAKCRWCTAEFEYTATRKPELPLMCWKCCDATLEKYAAAPPRIVEKKPFVKL